VVATVLALLSVFPPRVRAVSPRVPASMRSARRFDTARYAILPFAQSRGRHKHARRAPTVASCSSRASARLDGGRLADRTRVYDRGRARARVSIRIPFDTGSPSPRLGRGIWDGQLWSFGDTLRLTAGRTTRARGAPLRRSRRGAATGRSGRRSRARDSLLGADLGAHGGPARSRRARLRALRATRWANGSSGDLGARAGFRAAIAADSAFAARTGMGQGVYGRRIPPQTDARSYVISSRTRVDRRLGPAGCASCSRAKHVRAALARSMRGTARSAADSQSFGAWYGWRSATRPTERDPGSPRYPRFTFRGSYERRSAYRRALLLHRRST